MIFHYHFIFIQKCMTKVIPQSLTMILSLCQWHALEENSIGYINEKYLTIFEE